MFGDGARLFHPQTATLSKKNYVFENPNFQHLPTQTLCKALLPHSILNHLFSSEAGILIDSF